jgi:predicted dinucleotide-binding enzyme
MSTISIIGSGGMAGAIGGLAAKAGHTVELMSRAAAKARALAKQVGAGATTATYGAAPAGDIVILAVPYASAAGVVTKYGDALNGKVIIDITLGRPRPQGPRHPRRQFQCAGDRHGRPRRRTCREGVQHHLRPRTCPG